jgi:ElaB/YqjD/DUF883 family membrane-anchored ribosome-binding protein
MWLRYPGHVGHAIEVRAPGCGTATGPITLYSGLTQENSMNALTRTNSALSNGNDAVEAGLNKVAASVHGAVDKLAGAVDNAAKKIEPAIEHTAQLAHHAVDKAADAAGPTAAWLSKRGDMLKATQRRMAADTGDYVSAHPWKSIGIAAAAGFLISRLFR